jgi:hypothetical protein
MNSKAEIPVEGFEVQPAKLKMTDPQPGYVFSVQVGTSPPRIRSRVTTNFLLASAFCFMFPSKKASPSTDLCSFCFEWERDPFTACRREGATATVPYTLFSCVVIRFIRAVRWEYINPSLILFPSPGSIPLSSPKQSHHIHQFSTQHPIQTLFTPSPKILIKMKFTLALLPSILGMAFASPAPEARSGVEARQITTVGLTFYGADNDAQYSISAPADGSHFTISMCLHLLSSGLCFRHFPSPSPTPPLLPFSPTLFPYPPSLSPSPSPLCYLLHALSSPKLTHPLAFLPTTPYPRTLLASSRFAPSALHLLASNCNH